MITHAQKEKLKKVGKAAFIFLLCYNIYIFYKSNHRSLDIPSPVVKAANPVIRDMAEYIIQTGNTVAYNSVDLVARVEGYLNEINFTDGSIVKKGKLLFVIEPEPYLAKLNEAKASLDAQEAIHTYDKAEHERQKRMYRENATSLNNVEKWFAKSEQSAAEVAKARENLNIANINYGYTHVEAPFDGRIGRHLIDKDNLVGNGVATELANIEQLDPIYVYFNLNEIDLIPLRIAAHAKGIDENHIKKVPVSIELQGQSSYKFQGKLDFVNTSLDASTGTLEFRALLPNKDYALLPGLFVKVRMAISDPTPTLTIPDTAIQYDQIGAYVLTVNNEHLVEMKRVQLAGLEDGIRGIKSGLTKTDLVIVDGLQNATPGGAVTPEIVSLAKASPLTKKAPEKTPQKATPVSEKKA